MPVWCCATLVLTSTHPHDIFHGQPPAAADRHIFIYGNLARVLLAAHRITPNKVWLNAGLQWCDDLIKKEMDIATPGGGDGGYWDTGCKRNQPPLHKSFCSHLVLQRARISLQLHAVSLVVRTVLTIHIWAPCCSSGPRTCRCRPCGVHCRHGHGYFGPRALLHAANGRSKGAAVQPRDAALRNVRHRWL